MNILIGCQFYPLGEYLRFVRVPENLRVGDKIMTLEVHGKHNLTLESIDKVRKRLLVQNIGFYVYYVLILTINCNVNLGG